MPSIDRLIQDILSGIKDSNIRFNTLVRVLKHFGFSLRINGDHHIFFREGIEEIINIQPLGSKAKKYQVKQVRNILHKYKMYS